MRHNKMADHYIKKSFDVSIIYICISVQLIGPLGDLDDILRNMWVWSNFYYIDGWGISGEIALIWISLDFADDKSILLQIMIDSFKQQAIVWVDVDQDRYRHTMSPGHIELLGTFSLHRPHYIKI